MALPRVATGTYHPGQPRTCTRDEIARKIAGLKRRRRRRACRLSYFPLPAHRPDWNACATTKAFTRLHATRESPREPPNVSRTEAMKRVHGVLAESVASSPWKPRPCAVCMNRWTPFSRAAACCAPAAGRSSSRHRPGLIARKIAATLASTGTPALSSPGRRPARNIGGQRLDSSSLSESGESEELNGILPMLWRCA